MPEVEGDKASRKKFKSYPSASSTSTSLKFKTAQGKLYLFVAVDRTSKFAVAKLYEKANTQTARAFLEALVAAVPYRQLDWRATAMKRRPLRLRLSEGPPPGR